MSGNSNYSSLITTTLQDHGREIFDGISTNNPLYWLLKKSGNIKVRSAGRTFTHPILYATNSSFAMYDKLGTISLPITDNITRAEYNVKVAAGSIVLSTIDMAMNAGSKEKLLDYAEEKKLEAEISMSQLMGAQMFKDGSVTEDFGGLQYLIHETPSSQTDVGGITASSASGNSYWRNYAYTTAVTAFNTSQAGLTAFNSVLNNTVIGNQGPRVIVTTTAIYQLYELGLTSNMRYADGELGDAGFRTLQYSTLPVVFDANCPAGNVYFIDTNSLWLQVLAQANMEVTQFEQRENQLSTSCLMYLAGNLTTGSRRTNGVITSVTA